jgi:hypothetical protein
VYLLKIKKSAVNPCQNFIMKLDLFNKHTTSLLDLLLSRAAKLCAFEFSRLRAATSPLHPAQHVLEAGAAAGKK